MAKKESNFNTIEEMQKEKADWVAQTKRLNNFKGIKNTLTKLYTSSGHFIFELLQNAEDVSATSVNFKLYKNKLVFEHNGTRPFNINDIDSITNIGDSTKEDNGNTIGKFGIGFKSVFEYTASPEIHSENYHFQIIDLFIPQIIDSYKDYDSSKTVIILPFNGDKSSSTCYEEIKNSFNELKSTVLLFLQNIAEITCTFETTKIKISRTNSCKIVNCPENVCGIQKSVFEGNNNVKSIKPLFYKRFFKTIKVLNEDKEEKNITIGIAFKITNTTEDEKWKISPIFKKDSTVPGGNIFAYFPCKAEEKKFCFHIHAPFALTVDREKLREDAANTKVIEEIGTLLCESMEELKADGLVTLELYKALPNEKDDNDLGKYLVIRSKIENFFLNNPYILMADGSYQEPKNRIIGSHNIQKLLSDSDLALLNLSTQESFWVKNPMQNQRDYNFLVSLRISEYGIADFLTQFVALPKKSQQVYKEFITILEERGAPWFAKVYSLMHTSWSSIEKKGFFEERCTLQLCYCEDKKLHKFDECYLSNLIIGVNDYPINCVNPECFSNKFSETNIKVFLQNNFNLQEFGVGNYVNYLYSNYCKKQDNKLEDIKLFYELYKKDNSIIEDMKNFKILISETGICAIPKVFYIPEEIDDTVKNISIYYDFYRQNDQQPFLKLNPDYKKIFGNEKDFKEFIVFLKNLGCQSGIRIEESSCKNNPEWAKIQSESTITHGGHAKVTDTDYKIKYFYKFLNRPMNEAVFDLIWSFMTNTSPMYAFCIYKSAAKNPANCYLSQIAIYLSRSKWVLQEDNGKTDYVRPYCAYESKLPSHCKKTIIENRFIQYWLDAIEFGKQELEQNEEQKKKNEFLKSIGIKPEWVQNIKDLCSAGVRDEEITKALQEMKSSFVEKQISNDSEEVNIERIMEKALESFEEAPDREFVKKNVNVHEGFSKIKDKATAYLKGRYMNSNDMNCQICRRSMPFKRENGEPYFEVVQLFNNNLVPKDIEYNYIALCPICSARMNVYYQHDKKKQKDLFRRVGYCQNENHAFRITLDKEDSIYFSIQHLIALKQVIKKTMNYEGI